MGDVLIDLGETSGSGPPTPDRPLPWLAVRVTATLLLPAALAGGVHRGPPVEPVVLPAGLADTVVVRADRLYLIGAGSPQPAGPVPAAAQNRTISTYALPSGRLLSRTTAALDGGLLTVDSAGGTLLTSAQSDRDARTTTVALIDGTDRARWRRPAQLVGLYPADDLVVLRDDRPDSADLWSGVDLTTGTVRWTIRRPARGHTAETAPDMSGYPRLLATSTPDGRLDLHDAHTGALLRTAPVGAVGSLWPVGDELLVGGRGTTAAYGLADLARRWQAPIDLSRQWAQDDCGPVVCLFRPDGGLTAVDNRTGARLWTSNRWSSAERAGDHLLALGRDNTIAVLDPATGAVQGTFGGWQGLAGPRPGDSVIGLRDTTGGELAHYARLDPDTLGIRVLGSATRISGDCQTTATVLICRRIDASVGIWPLK